MIVYVLQHPDFFLRTELDDKIIMDRLLKLHKMNNNAHYVQVDQAWKDYEHLLPWFSMYEKQGSCLIRTR
jgi:hypothetical protein